ncbi:MAG TPA: S8 family serine peptidase [Candidatus Polarisedimenticolaceae bacterium]|nr:S8 family serine peptidase [Candidatus Polarisedimenticolaceae bacterium]
MEEARSRRPTPAELRRRIEQGDALLLDAGVFDPLRDPLPAFAAGRTISGAERTFLVQFARELTATERRLLEEDGVRFVDYVPSHAYLLQASPPTFARLRSNALVRWADAFRGGYKVAGVLRSAAWREAVYLDLRLLPGESGIALMDRVRALDPAIEPVSLRGDAAPGATLRVLVPQGRLHPFAERVAEDAAVWSVQPWYLPEIHNDDGIWVEQSYDTVNQRTYAVTAPMWSHGITGTGQLAGISDSGLDSDMCFFRTSAALSAVTDAQSLALPGTGTIDLTRKVAAYYVIPGATPYDGNTVCGGRPESWHGTHTSGTIVGDNFLTLSTGSGGGHDGGDGMAPNAKLIFQDIGSETTGCLDGLQSDFHLIAQQAYDAGVRVHSNSWGASVGGAYTSASAEVDEISYGREDLLFVYSAGNAGPSANTVGSPGTAKAALTVGACGHGSSNAIAAFSSRGPTDDGRWKPDLTAPGTSTVSAAGDLSHTSGNCGTKTLSGTSMAAPTVAGGAVLLRQYFTDGFYPSGVRTAADALGPSSALLKAALVNGAIDLSLTSQATMLSSLSPDGNQGWGRIHLDNVAFFATPTRDPRRTRVWDKWNGTGLTTGQVDAYPLQVAAGQPLKVTLAWTDPQGSLLAAVALVNDLDLEVVDPGGGVYRGNVFSSGESAQGGSSDLLNNVEVVFLTAPVAGTWTLRVKATSVPGAPSAPGSDRQGYGLVATFGDCGVDLAAPSGVVATDHGAAGLQVGWEAVPGATGYQVYRAAGTCAAAGTSYHLVGQTTGTSFTDTLVQGGFGHAYRVRAVTPCGEGALSSCASATSSANCTLSPVFGGLESAVNDTGTTACDALLGWSAGESACPAAPGVTYDVYRSTTPYFTPGPATLRAWGQTGTTYRDTAVTPNQAFFYRVLAEDATTANGGPGNGGNLDGNGSVRAVTPTSSGTYAGTWVDDADFAARLEMQDPWRITHQSNHTAGGTLAYHSAADGSTVPALTCAAVTSPPIPLQADTTPQLLYFTRYDMESQRDGVVVEVSPDGGAWSDLPPVGGYPSTFALTQSPPSNACAYAAAQGAFSGRQAAWTEVVHDLSPFAGQTVRVRFRMSTDPSTGLEGFYLDDLRVTRAFAPGSCGTDLRLTETAVWDVCAGGGAGSDNGILESGEDATVVVFAQNVGDQGATAITGTLSSAAPGVVVTRSTASFGPADAGEETFSVGPHFGVWVSPAVACGTQLPFTLALTAAQGTFSRTFGLTVGRGAPLCSQVVCGGALPLEDRNVLVAKTAGGDPLQLTFDPSCHASDATVYWGHAAGSMTGLAWTGAACGSGPSGSALFSPGTPAPGSLHYFVVVPTNGVKEGSYGKDSTGNERTRASGLGACNLPQQLGGVCP